MLRSYRGIVAALIGLAAGVAFLLLVVDLASVSSQIEKDATDRADKYREDAGSYKERRCLGLALPSYEDCNRQTDQAARENQRVELDLAAQRMTAWWTQVMGIAALIGMALSAVGVWLVAVTFRETRRGVNTAWRIGEAQTAAYVTVNQIRLFDRGLPVQSFGLLEIKNLGASQALNIDITVLLFVEGVNPPVEVELRAAEGAQRNLIAHEAANLFFADDQGLREQIWSGVPEGLSHDVRFRAECTLTYEDVFGNCWEERGSSEVGRPTRTVGVGMTMARHTLKRKRVKQGEGS